jgi:serine/threonine-protein kinase RsbW
MGNISQLKVRGVFHNLAQISEFVGNVAAQMGFSPKGIYAVQMAVDEACTNIIEHGYEGEDRGDLELICVPQKDVLQITIRDWGRPFNPEEVPDPDIMAPLEERSERGLGLFLMRKLMDEVSFRIDAEQGNEVIMKKRLNSSS